MPDPVQDAGTLPPVYITAPGPSPWLVFGLVTLGLLVVSGFFSRSR